MLLRQLNNSEKPFTKHIPFWYMAAILVMSTVVTPPLEAQPRDVNVDILVRADGNAYIYHDMPIPFSHGFHVYRQSGGGDWLKLTDEPIFPVQNGYELQQNLGSVYNRVRGISESDDPQTVFLRTRSAGDQAMILVYSVPELAKQLAHVFVDEDAPVGNRATYRFELVNNLNNPVGTEFEHEAMLTPFTPPTPENLQVTNYGGEIVMTWNYPGVRQDQPDYVIRFRPRYRRTDGGPVQDVTNRIPLRTVGDSQFEYRIRVPANGTEYEFWVQSVDYSGQASPESNRVRVVVGDNIPPQPVGLVSGRATPAFESEISWPVSTAVDLAGYHVYRGLSDEEEMERITDELLPPLQTSYLDTDTEPGTLYRYKVTVMDLNGNESERSNTATVLIVDYTYPKPVKSVQAVYDEETHQITIGWEAGEVYENLRSYRILRRQVNPPAGIAFTQINPGPHTALSITDGGVLNEGFTEGVSFEYGVAVVNRSGNISDTLFTRVQIPVLTPPEAPGVVTAEMRSNQRVALSWNASDSRDVTHYRIYRTDIEEDLRSELQTVSRGIRFFRDEDVPMSRTFVYGVAAVDSVGNESIEMLADTLITGYVHPPVPAHNLQALATENGVLLSWQLRGDGDRINRFRIYRSAIATGRFEAVGETESNELRFTDSSGQAGMWYKVFPVDKTGRESREARATQAVSR